MSISSKVHSNLKNPNISSYTADRSIATNPCHVLFFNFINIFLRHLKEEDQRLRRIFLRRLWRHIEIFAIEWPEIPPCLHQRAPLPRPPQPPGRQCPSHPVSTCVQIIGGSTRVQVWFFFVLVVRPASIGVCSGCGVIVGRWIAVGNGLLSLMIIFVVLLILALAVVVAVLIVLRRRISAPGKRTGWE